MKRIIRAAIAAIMALTAVAGASAQNATIQNIGYTTTDRIDVKGAAFKKAGTFTVGALMQASDISAYKGCRVLGMRVAVANNPGRSRLFLHKLKDSELTEIASQYQRLYEGWNELYFNGEGYEIAGDEGLFFGYDYVETEEMVASQTGGLCGTGEDTPGAFMLFQNNGLYNVSGVGMLCVQLIVDISSLPAERIAIPFFDSGFKYKKRGENLEIFTLIQNNGREKISSLTLSYTLDGGQAVDVEAKLDSAINPGTSYTWQQVISLPADLAIGQHTFKLHASRINGNVPTEGNDGLSEARFAIYENSMERDRVYVECYTSQSNYNAASIDTQFENLKTQFGDKMSLVQIHAPGTTLGISDAAYLHDLYAYTVPSFTANRSWFPGEAHVAYDLNDYLGVLPDFMIESILSDIVSQDVATPAFANVKLTAVLDPVTRQLEVKATGEALPEATAIYGDLALTLMLVEDNVKADQTVLNSAGRPTVNKSYRHNDVLRAFITPATGARLAINDGKFDGTYTITVPDGYDSSKLRVTGILTKALDKVTASDLRDVDVTNANEVKVKLGSGVTTITSDSSERIVEGYYTLGGLRLSAAPASGIYIIRYTDGSTRKASR